MDAIRDLVVALRPWQWSKNLFVLAPVFFAGVLNDPRLLSRALAGVLVFSAASAAIYVFNDLHDLESDRAHPDKCRRPLAAGRIGTGTARVLAAGLGLASLGGAWALSHGVLGIVLSYILLNVAYTLALKQVPILDVFCISVGFLLRVLAGGEATGISLSHWLLVCTLTLSLFLAFGKRRQEVATLGGINDSGRILGEGYTLVFLDQAITITATATMLTYLLYLVEGCPPAVESPGAALLTSFFVLYGIFRYLALVVIHRRGDDPAAMLFTDRPLLLTCLGWVVSWLLVLYVG